MVFAGWDKPLVGQLRDFDSSRPETGKVTEIVRQTSHATVLKLDFARYMKALRSR